LYTEREIPRTKGKIFETVGGIRLIRSWWGEGEKNLTKPEPENKL